MGSDILHFCPPERRRNDDTMAMILLKFESKLMARQEENNSRKLQRDAKAEVYYTQKLSCQTSPPSLGGMLRWSSGCFSIMIPALFSTHWPIVLDRRMNEHCASSMVGKQENHTPYFPVLSESPLRGEPLSLHDMRSHHSYIVRNNRTAHES